MHHAIVKGCYAERKEAGAEEQLESGQSVGGGSRGIGYMTEMLVISGIAVICSAVLDYSVGVSGRAMRRLTSCGMLVGKFVGALLKAMAAGVGDQLLGDASTTFSLLRLRCCVACSWL